MEEPPSMESLDPETEFLASGRQTGNEWEMFKENVRPLKRGRKVELLNDALKSQTVHGVKKSLVEKRRRLIEGIDEYIGEDPLQPWLECIKWVQESFPAGGESSGLIVIYEQCVRMFWHDDRYKNDLRYLKVWLEYAENCADAEVIYSFLETNQIGQNHSIFYSSFAQLLESRHKMKKADEIYSLGIARKAQPEEKLKALYRKFLTRSARVKIVTEEQAIDDDTEPARSFGTILAGENRRQTVQKGDLLKRKALHSVDVNARLAVYIEGETKRRHQLDASKSDEPRTWHTLGTQAERNKENAPLPSKWTRYKIPQKTGANVRRTVPSPRLEIFVNEECPELPASGVDKGSHSTALQLRNIDMRNLKSETQLLKENPLRNFPASSLPR